MKHLSRKDFRKEFGRKLHNARIDQGLSQLELSWKVGQNATVISFWETGRQLPSLYNLRLLSIALDTSVKYFLSL